MMAVDSLHNAPAPPVRPALAVERRKVVIVGSGFAGLCMAIKLQEAGITDFVVLERAQSLGGTWRDNHYPGCACDVPAYLYSYSFAPSKEWSRMYAESAEIRAYLERVARAYGIHDYLRFGAELAKADHVDGRWRIETTDGRRWNAEIFVVATGGLSRPALPRIEGLSTFAGPSFHSAQWRHDVPLAGKRVGVIGTGASAIQFVPHVAAVAGHLDVFQRTPPWIVPKEEVIFSAVQRGVLAKVPGAERLFRGLIYSRHELRALLFSGDSRLMKLGQRIALKHIAAQIADPVLRDQVTPRYAMGCKRILISNDYYPALARPNVSLVTERIARVVPEGVIMADGALRPLDVLIHGTGFAVHDYFGPVEVRGRDGVSLREAWTRGAEAYLGTAVAGFPNLFILVGPNTGLGHNSIVYMIESQVQYIMDALAQMKKRQWSTVEVRADVQAAFNAKIAERLDKTVWSAGCESWYVNEHGKNTTLWPGFTFEFRAKTRRFDADNYQATEVAR